MRGEVSLDVMGSLVAEMRTGGIAKHGALSSANVMQPCKLWVRVVSQVTDILLLMVVIPSLACSRPPPDRTSWLSVCDGGSRARLFQTSLSCWQAFLIPSGPT